MSASCAAPVFFVRKLRCNRNLLNNFSTAPRCTPQFFRMLLRSYENIQDLTKVFENRNILCAARLHFAADVLLHYAARCNYAAKKTIKAAAQAARLTSLVGKDT